MSRLPMCLLLLAGIATPSLAFSQSTVNPASPSFSIDISIPRVVKADSDMLLEIAMSNTSDKDIGYGVIPGWPVWQMFQIDVRDAVGHLATETPAGKRIRIGPLVVITQFGVSLAPGKVL